MSNYDKITGYGVLIGGGQINDMMQALALPLTMEEKKRFHIGHKVIDPISYEDMEDHYKAKYDNVNIDDPAFLVTDFGNRWMDYIDMYLDQNYPLLDITPTTVPGTIAVYAGSTRRREGQTQSFMGRPISGALPPRSKPGALPPRNKPATIETTMPVDDNASKEATDKQKEQMSGFLRDAGISTLPAFITWEELMSRGGWQGCIREPWRYRKN